MFLEDDVVSNGRVSRADERGSVSLSRGRANEKR